MLSIRIYTPFFLGFYVCLNIHFFIISPSCIMLAFWFCVHIYINFDSYVPLLNVFNSLIVHITLFTRAFVYVSHIHSLPVSWFLLMDGGGGGTKVGSTPLPRGFEREGRKKERCTKNEREGELRQAQVEGNFNIFLPFFHVLGVGFK